VRALRFLLSRHCLMLVCLCLALTAIQNQALAADKPARALVAAFEYPGLTIPSDGKAEVDLILINRGNQDETVTLEVLSKPEGWSTSFESYGKTVSGVFLEEEGKKSVTFQAQEEEAETRLSPGTYRFQIRAESEDAVLSRTASVVFRVAEDKTTEKTLALSTSYPMLRGSSDSTFEFSLNVANKSGEDGLFNLQAKSPKGWETSFKPAYEDKQISSLHIKGNESKSVKIEVQPPRQAQTGEYPIEITVWRGQAEAKAELKVELTGTYKLDCATPNGLLSTEVIKGNEGIMSILVENTGSAVQQEVSLLPFKPENWQVEFKPETISGLEPGQMEQVDVHITPPEDALVGDYSVGVQAKGQKAKDSVEFRITVKASAAWGWIGVGIIVLVIAGLAVTFKVLGRR